MNIKNFPLFLAVASLLAVGGQGLARHVTHLVTPKNIDEQPFSFTVQIKDVGEFKEVEITVRQKAGHLAPAGSATGSVVIEAWGKKMVVLPAITRVVSNGVQTYTFRVSPSDLDRSHFAFTETPQDARIPFPSPGDYWGFDLSDFVSSRDHGKVAAPPEKTDERLAKLIQTMEGFRTKMPAPHGLGEENGHTVKELEPYTMTHLSGVARRLEAKSRAECLVLLTYLKDPDPKLRFIAAQAIYEAVDGYRNGLDSAVDNILDTRSDGHLKMVRRFAELIDKLSM